MNSSLGTPDDIFTSGGNVPVPSRGQRLPGLMQKFSGPISEGLRSRLLSTSSVNHSEEYRRGPGQAETYGHRTSHAPEGLATPQRRSMRQVENRNPNYRWERYYKSEEELKRMKKHLRHYYERNNYLIAQYLYIDRLLDYSLPYDLLQERNSSDPVDQVHRNPTDVFRWPVEDTPLLVEDEEQSMASLDLDRLALIEYETSDPSERIVIVALYTNIVANVLMLGGKVAATWMTGSLSIMASLVRTALDCLSTLIVWTTTKLVLRHDQHGYPVGRRRLQPVTFLVFSVITITAFFLVALECLIRLISGDQSLVHLGGSAIGILFGAVVIKSSVWLRCRFIRGPSVRALTQDAMSAPLFDLFSILIPIVGFYAKAWWIDAAGGILLSLSVMSTWASASSEHVRNLTGASATADERNVLLYLTMCFAKTIKYIQNIQAYHTGDKLNVEVDIVLDEDTTLRDSQDLGESLQYVLESVPTVDRAFIHLDYWSWNSPS